MRSMHRFLCLLLTLCLLLPFGSTLAETAEGSHSSFEPITLTQPAGDPDHPLITPNPENTALWPVAPETALHADYQLTFSLNADNIPFDKTFHYADWQKLLQKLSLSGSVTSYQFPFPQGYYKHKGWLNLNGKHAISLNMQSIGTHRYLTSNALGGDSLFFQMDNFFEFMTKPTYFGINAQIPALFLYPEATLYLAQLYEDQFAPYFAGEGSRSISYEQLHEMALGLNAISLNEEDFNQPYRFLTSLLSGLYLHHEVNERIGMLDTYLDFLDPEKKGLTVDVEGDKEVWSIGGRTVYASEKDGDFFSFKLTLPDENGNTLTVFWNYAPDIEGNAQLEASVITDNGEAETISLRLLVSGLPLGDFTSAAGTVQLSLGGKYLRDSAGEYHFRYSINRSAAALPYHTDVSLELMHPETALPAFTVNLSADVSEMPAADFKAPKIREGLSDFFRLNETVISQYVELYGATAVTALVPFMLEIPSGVLNDLYYFIDKHGILPALGIY